MRAAGSALDEPDAVRELRDELIRERTKLDAMIALFDTTLQRVNGAAPHADAEPPIEEFERKPTRRLVLLQAMADNPDVWEAAGMRQVLVDAGLLTADDRGAKHFYNVTNALKKRREIIHVSPGHYRISPLGVQVAQGAK